MNDHERTEFERQSQAVLDESVARLDGRDAVPAQPGAPTRLLEAESLAASPWKKWFSVGTLMPAGAVAAVVLVALTLWSGPRGVDVPDAVARGDATSTFEDLELLADNDAFDDEGPARGLRILRMGCRRGGDPRNVIRRRHHAGWFGTTGVAIALAAAAGPLPAADTSTPAKVSQPKAASPKPAAPVAAADEELLEFPRRAPMASSMTMMVTTGWISCRARIIRRIAGAKK